MKHQTHIKLDNIEIFVYFDYEPYEPQSQFSQGEPETAEIERVFLLDTDITEWLSIEKIEEIEELCIKSIPGDTKLNRSRSAMNRSEQLAKFKAA